MVPRRRQSAHGLMQRNLRLFSRSGEMERRSSAVPANKKISTLEKFEAITRESEKNRERAINILQKRMAHLKPENAKRVAMATYNYVMNGVPYREALKRALEHFG